MVALGCGSGNIVDPSSIVQTQVSDWLFDTGPCSVFVIMNVTGVDCVYVDLMIVCILHRSYKFDLSVQITDK